MPVLATLQSLAFLPCGDWLLASGTNAPYLFNCLRALLPRTWGRHRGLSVPTNETSLVFCSILGSFEYNPHSASYRTQDFLFYVCDWVAREVLPVHLQHKIPNLHDSIAFASSAGNKTLDDDLVFRSTLH